MLIQQKFLVQAPREKVWEFFLDVKTMSRCLPGLEELQELDDKTYQGSLGVKIGPISASFQGQVTVLEIAHQDHRAAMAAAAKDSRLASILKAKMTMCMEEASPGQTEVAIDTDLNVFGKLGQFGYWVFKKKASDMMEEFASRVRSQLESFP